MTAFARVPDIGSLNSDRRIVRDASAYGYLPAGDQNDPLVLEAYNFKPLDQRSELFPIPLDLRQTNLDLTLNFTPEELLEDEDINNLLDRTYELINTIRSSTGTTEEFKIELAFANVNGKVIATTLIKGDSKFYIYNSLKNELEEVILLGYPVNLYKINNGGIERLVVGVEVEDGIVNFNTDESGSWVVTVDPNKSSYVEAQGIELTSGIHQGKIIVNNVNLRAGSSTAIESLGSLRIDTKISILRQVDGWSEVMILDGPLATRQGWVRDDLLLVTDVQPTTDIDSTPTPFPTQTYRLVSTDRGFNLESVAAEMAVAPIIAPQLDMMSSNSEEYLAIYNSLQRDIRSKIDDGTLFISVRHNAPAFTSNPNIFLRPGISKSQDLEHIEDFECVEMSRQEVQLIGKDGKSFSITLITERQVGVTYGNSNFNVLSPNDAYISNLRNTALQFMTSTNYNGKTFVLTMTDDFSGGPNPAGFTAYMQLPNYGLDSSGKPVFAYGMTVNNNFINIRALVRPQNVRNFAGDTAFDIDNARLSDSLGVSFWTMIIQYYENNRYLSADTLLIMDNLGKSIMNTFMPIYPYDAGNFHGATHLFNIDYIPDNEELISHVQLQIPQDAAKISSMVQSVFDSRTGNLRRNLKSEKIISENRRLEVQKSKNWGKVPAALLES